MSDKVLLLEESEAISKNIFITLQESGFEVLSTNSITEGLYILSEYDIGVIIADMNMNLGRITYFTNTLKSNNKFNLIPLLMLADDKGKNSWKQINGVENWIIKPFSANKLLRSIRNIIV
ncbi:MAG: hypothetical protein PF693_18690 [Spirochaetia bacterium]|jgi:DNA-binding response OmpR family regulator|nr:hypothetical protein [Spirochaetia bacterium]